MLNTVYTREGGMSHKRQKKKAHTERTATTSNFGGAFFSPLRTPREAPDKHLNQFTSL